jgi:hypothetical protein
MDLTTCPACGSPAEVLWRESWPSTEGPVEHAKVGCVRRHWFLLPVDQLASTPDLPAHEAAPGQYRWSSTST